MHIYIYVMLHLYFTKLEPGGLAGEGRGRGGGQGLSVGLLEA